ncbi:MAG TPA: cob(I)yrinic acid a,c-diamide adenosyltransferase [Candidatus Cloacimonadota bacterium]|nr:cob(I)yrinic acid a,c-diamide adenosyltransferase [Candidatus Cloacimonadota bacterium]
MSITTKTGDRGMTSLFSGERVYKDDLRVDAYGSLDELDAQIGDAKHLVPQELKEELIGIQRQLYRAMGNLASKSGDYPLPLLEEDVELLTARVHYYESLLNLKGFVVPGSLPASAKLDICRTIARRAERRIIALSRHEEVPGPILSFVNRLSDYFFITARWVEDREGAIVYKKG